MSLQNFQLIFKRYFKRKTVILNSTLNQNNKDDFLEFYKTPVYPIVLSKIKFTDKNTDNKIANIF